MKKWIVLGSVVWVLALALIVYMAVIVSTPLRAEKALLLETSKIEAVRTTESKQLSNSVVDAEKLMKQIAEKKTQAVDRSTELADNKIVVVTVPITVAATAAKAPIKVKLESELKKFR